MPRQQDVPARPVRAKRHKTSAVRVGRSRTGKGVFARRRYQPYETVGEILGELIHDAEYGSDYCFHLGDNTFLEPQAPFRFINHSCDPNCEFDWVDVPGDGVTTGRKRLFLFAMGDIRPDDELTIEYNWSAAGAIPCRCGSEVCRGWVVDAAEMEQLG